ncbi:MAG: DsbA family oxidoreductase, partial [Pseudomonadota bacterium]
MSDERTNRNEQHAAADGPALLVDIVSDVVCPWCVIGYKHFEQALGAVGAAARIRWRAFELNPDMGPDGEDAAEHVARKYGASAEKHAAAQAEIAALGAAVGFTFTPGPSRMRNTFRAHQLLRWAGTLGAKHTVKLALFKAHFTERRNVDDPVVLTEIAAEAGL